jgi:phosphatidate cytidylyltransferase
MPVPRRGGGSRSDFGEDWVEEPLDDWFDLRGDSSREQEAAAPDSAAMPAPRGAEQSQGEPSRAPQQRVRRRPQGGGTGRRQRAPKPKAPPKPRRRGSDLFNRVAIAVPAILLAIGFVDLGGTGWALLMAGFGCIAIHELNRLLERWRTIEWIGFAAVLGMCAAARYGDLTDVYAVAVGAVPLALLSVMPRSNLKGSTVSIAGTLLGVGWIAVAFSHAVLLRQLPHGQGVVIDVMIGTFFADTGAYLGGRIFGRHKLAPRISPNKTWEGLLCGVLLAIVGVFIADLYETAWLSHTQALALGGAIAFLGPIGDLFESLIKRDAGIKDAGTLLGAHGGVLDRLDAISFTIVAGYYIWAAMVH